MLKINPLLLCLSTLLITSTSQAQFTQMIVDNNNQVMPIFFHDGPTQQQPTYGLNQVSLAEPSFHYPTPVIIPKRIVKPAPPRRATPRNPLTGPYFITPQRHRIMDAAHSALGTPYIYGGNNPSRGLDCSSLMQFIHKKALGVSIPRTAAQQRNRSKTIDYNNLQPGDMLFFKIDRRNNHVGIYIGDGKFIHASSSNKRASITSMNLPYWKKRFVKFGSYING